MTQPKASLETVVCVGAVVRRDAEVLLVRQAKGHPLEGQWTIPWGRLEPGESPASAAVRETREEGNVEVHVIGLLGVQELPQPWRGWIALVYLCTHITGTPEGDGGETDAARYFSREAFELLAEPIEPWSAWLVRRVLAEDYDCLGSHASNPYLPSPGFL